MRVDAEQPVARRRGRTVRAVDRGARSRARHRHHHRGAADGVLAGACVLVVGGRQSAYEWAALIAEAGAERVDVVHRHDVPRFERVGWSFVDAYIESTVAIPGWWRNLRESEREEIGRRFWDAG